jgi:hypothetical protein
MDELDLMIARVKARRSAKTPLYITVAEVYYEFADEMSDETFLALEEVGRASIANEGQPVDPSTGKPLPDAVAGFAALVAEALMAGGS